MLAHVLIAMITTSGAVAANLDKAPLPAAPDQFCRASTLEAWEQYKNFHHMRLQILQPLVNVIHAKLSSITPEQRKAIASGKREAVDQELHESTRENPYVGEAQESCAPTADFLRSDGTDPKYPYRMNICRHRHFRFEITPTIKREATLLTISPEGKLRLTRYEHNSKVAEFNIPILPTLKEEEELLKEQAEDQLPNWSEFFRARLTGCPFVEDPTQLPAAPPTARRSQPVSEKALSSSKDACLIAKAVAWDELAEKRRKWDAKHPGMAETLKNMLTLVDVEIRPLESAEERNQAMRSLNLSETVKGMNHEGPGKGSSDRRNALLARFLPDAGAFQVSYFDEIPGSTSGDDESILFKFGKDATKDREMLENLLEVKAAGKTWTRLLNEALGADCPRGEAPAMTSETASTNRREGKKTKDAAAPTPVKSDNPYGDAFSAR